MRRPRPIALLVLLLTAVIGFGVAIGAPLVQRVVRLTVYDANNKKVGEAISFVDARWPVVALKVAGDLMVFQFTEVYFFGNASAVYFDDFGCAGNAYLPVDSLAPPVPKSVAVAPPSRLWVKASTTVESLVPKSILIAHPSFDAGDCETGPFSPVSVFKAAGPTDLSPFFTPPFSVR